MHKENQSAWSHDHIFDAGSEAAERSTRMAMLMRLTTTTST